MLIERASETLPPHKKTYAPHQKQQRHSEKEWSKKELWYKKAKIPNESLFLSQE